jgi:hypothetical protein
VTWGFSLPAGLRGAAGPVGGGRRGPGERIGTGGAQLAPSGVRTARAAEDLWGGVRSEVGQRPGALPVARRAGPPPLGGPRAKRCRVLPELSLPDKKQPVG